MVSLTFSGDDELVRRMSALSVELRRSAVKDAVRQAAEPMAARMAQLAPRGPDAPHIAESIKIQSVSRIDGVAVAEGAAAVVIGPSKTFFYGWFWEFGWKFHRTPHPFVRPAFEELKGHAQSIIARVLWGALTR